MNTTYPNLEEFLGTYFHQDWATDASAAVDVVKRYLAEWPPEEVHLTATELRHLLAASLTEAEVSATFSRAGNFYNPRADGLTYLEWLQKLCELFDSR